MGRRSDTPTIDELRGPSFELLDALPYDALVPFAARYFFERTSWVTWLHHALSLIALSAVIAAGLTRGSGWLPSLGQFVLGFVVMFTAGLVLHEALHAAAYRVAGAREIRWKVMWRYLGAYVVAERFVADRRTFFFVALAPFVVISPVLIALAFLFPVWSVMWLSVLLWHTAGVSGDWALINYYWLHRDREIYTWDEAGASYFYARAGGSRLSALGSREAPQTAGLTQSVGQAGWGTRTMLAIVVLASSLLMMASGLAVSSRAAGAVVATLLIQPVALIGLLAAAFIAAPHSSYGAWLDRFVPRLRDARVAILATLALWTISLALLAL